MGSMMGHEQGTRSRLGANHFAAGLVASFAALPIFSLLAMTVLPLVEFVDRGTWPIFGDGGWLGTLFVFAVMSFLGVVAMPISFGAATILFAVAAWLLDRRPKQVRPSPGSWIGAGLLVGLSVGLVMAAETYWQLNELVPSLNLELTPYVPLAVPTGALAILVCRRFIARVA